MTTMQAHRRRRTSLDRQAVRSLAEQALGLLAVLLAFVAVCVALAFDGAPQ